MIETQTRNSDSDQVPPDIVRNALEQVIGSANLENVNYTATNMKSAGISGNGLFRAEVKYDFGDRHHTIIFVAKRWNLDSWTARESRAPRSRDAMMWIDSYVRSEFLPPGLCVPIVSVSEESRGTWIVMEDVATEFDEYSSNFDDVNNVKAVLNAMAEFHAFWSNPDRQEGAESKSWLYGQQARIEMSMVAYADGLDHTAGREDVWAGPAVRRFTELVPQKTQDLWRHHLSDRSTVYQEIAGLPTTILHGDLVDRNLGIRRTETGPEVILVDWEWAGIGTPALDIASLLYHTYLLPYVGAFHPYSIPETPSDVASDPLARRIEVIEELQHYYHDRYLDHGGAPLTEVQWSRSWRLSLLVQALSWLPLHTRIAEADAAKEQRAAELMGYFSQLLQETLE